MIAACCGTAGCSVAILAFHVRGVHRAACRHRGLVVCGDVVRWVSALVVQLDLQGVRVVNGSIGLLFVGFMPVVTPVLALVPH